ncbi:immunoglobulin-like domain-containing protein, partial [Clostridium sp.]|uniref:immunoglobulin-like domain-containing protein n=1 Tax=Clostridium sp. TaxID=1506 RepID=UPI0025BA55DC
MINLRKIIALSLCTSMLINSSTSVVSAAIGNIRSFSIASNTNNNDKSEQNKNSIIWISKDSIEVGTEFNTMNGVKAYDEDGSDITNSISVLGQVDNSKPGEYELEYCVKNKSGETIKRTRKVTVKENKNKAELSQETTNKDNEVLNNQENVQEVKIVGPTFTRTYLGEAFNDKANIQAIDSNGKDITSLITVEGQVDVNKVGSYELKYSVADETGKTATLTRKVNVINKNIFNKYIEKINEETKEKIKELGFSIYLDNNTSKFLVENQSKEQLDPSKKDEVVFKIRVIDKDNKEKLKIELLGSDTGESEKLNSLKELEYSFGDYIEINTEEAKERFTIEGEMSGDIKAKLEEGATATEQDKIEDYSDGVDNIDYLLNVRFKITEEGIETVYNKAPEVRGLQPMEKLLTERSSQLEGISVIDDHDGNISNDNIEIYEEKNDEGKTIGLRYEVSDSWGRRVSVLRYLKSQIESSEEAQDIKYIDSEGNINLASENSRTGPNNSVITGLSSNVITVKGFTYSDNSDVRFKLRFNADNKKIEIFERDSRLFDNKIADKYFQIKLYSKTGTLKKELTINGSDRADNKKIDEFNNTNFEFGDQIEIYHA